MNTTLATPRRHAQPPDTTPTVTVTVTATATAAHHPVAERRIGAVDRAALHLGMALIKWGRRPGAARERRATRLERALAQRKRVDLIDAHRDRALLARAGTRLL